MYRIDLLETELSNFDVISIREIVGLPITLHIQISKLMGFDQLFVKTGLEMDMAVLQFTLKVKYHA